MFQRTGKELPGAGKFSDHTEGEPVWGQDLVYSFYTDDKTSYPGVSYADRTWRNSRGSLPMSLGSKGYSER